MHKFILMQWVHADAKPKTILNQEMKVTCLLILICHLKCLDGIWVANAHFRLYTKRKFQDKKNALSFTKRN